MKIRLLILVSGSVLAIAACNRNEPATTNAGSDANIVMDNGAAANMAAEAAPMTPQGFVNAAAASDRFEIESSKLAAASASSAAVKTFAEQMITAHTGSTAKLKTTASGMSPALTPDDALNAEQQAALDGLKGRTGADFDAAYAATQVDAHQNALDALKGYSAGDGDATLKTFADGLIPTVTAHLNMAKGLK